MQNFKMKWNESTNLSKKGKRFWFLNENYLIYLEKVHLPDKYRLQGYKDKNPEKFGSIDILPGIQTSVSRNVTNGRMELPVEKPNKGTVYIVLTMDPTNQHVDRREIQPKPEDRKISFDMSLNTNSM